jgi:hypothetical protein
MKQTDKCKHESVAISPVSSSLSVCMHETIPNDMKACVNYIWVVDMFGVFHEALV